MDPLQENKRVVDAEGHESERDRAIDRVKTSIERAVEQALKTPT